MRKFIALGISAISAGSIILSAGGGAASAAETTTTTTVPKTIVDDVCTSVPDAVKTVTDAIAGYDLEADDADYAAKKTAAESASQAFISALVTYLKDTASKSADLPIATSALTVRQGQYATALTTWSKSAADKTNHWGAVEYLTLQNSALAQLNTGLACPPPAEV